MEETLTKIRQPDTRSQDVLTVEGLKAYYINEHFGVKREVRAVDDISLTVRRNEIYGLAGESSSGKTSLIKTLAGAIRPPMRVIDGSVKFDFGGNIIDVYAQPRQDEGGALAESQLHHAGLDERAEPGAPGQAFLRRFRHAPYGA